MLRPIALCLEHLDAAAGEDRYLQCTALVGRQPGLRLDGAGAVAWRRDGDEACELWVTADERLALYRLEGAPEVSVHRAGRAVLAPIGKPVILLDGDELRLGGRRLGVHLHGPVSEPRAPAYLARAAAVMAVGTALAGCTRPVEVRDQPPSVAIVEPPPAADASAAPDTSPPVAVPVDAATPIVPPIEVRETPPAPMPVTPPTPPAPPHPTRGRRR